MDRQKKTWNIPTQEKNENALEKRKTKKKETGKGMKKNVGRSNTGKKKEEKESLNDGRF